MTGPTEAEALDALLDAMQRGGLAGGTTVLPRGQVPWVVTGTGGHPERAP